MKRFFRIALSLLMMIPATLQADGIAHDDVVILFDNDVHGHVDGYPKMAALKREMLQLTPHVLVVSMGDFSQGGPLCSISHGEYAVELMNRVGYDYVTLGNHEFDYGLEQLDKITSSLKATTLVCNYTDLRTGSLVYAPYVIRKLGDLKVALIGAVAPITKDSDSPQSFVDANGNDLYSFGRPDFYSCVQNAVDQVRQLGADFVILLSHLGDNPFVIETSEETIRRTNGIDVVLDGHAHSVIPCRELANKDDRRVLLSSTGAQFSNIGRMVLHQDKTCSTELIPTYECRSENAEIRDLIDSYKATFDKLPALATCDFDLAGFDTQYGTYDRAMQTNLGSLCADVFRIMGKADIGWINAGGIRSSIPAGKITYKELLSAFPFENMVSVMEFTGQQIADALEFGVYRAPADNGSYPQVSGLKYDLDTNVKADIYTDGIGNFKYIEEDSPRRVTNIRLLNPDNGNYEPLQMDRYYTVASIDYILKNHGCNGILDNGTIISDDQMIDIQLIEEYITKNLNGIIGDQYRQTVAEMK